MLEDSRNNTFITASHSIIIVDGLKSELSPYINGKKVCLLTFLKQKSEFPCCSGASLAG